MGFFGGLLKKTPDSLQLSDWLSNMTDAFLRMGDDTLSRDKASPDMLVCFTLINATHAANNTLHAAPKMATQIGLVYAELIAYYECLWQLCLLHQYSTPEDHDRISRLCGDVAFRIEKNMTRLFKSNPNVKQALSDAIGPSYSKVMHRAIPEYIYGERSYAFPETGDHIIDNVQSLTLRVESVGRIDGPQVAEVYNILLESTNKAPYMSLLTKFDFPLCKVLPGEFFN